MADDTKKRLETEAKARWKAETVEEAIRRPVRQTIETVVDVPRARLATDRGTTEWRSEMLPQVTSAAVAA